MILKVIPNFYQMNEFQFEIILFSKNILHSYILSN